MVEAGKIISTLAGFLCAHLTGGTSIICNSDTCRNHYVLFCQISTLACDTHFHTALLFCPGCLLRSGRPARVFEGAQPQMEMGRIDYLGVGFFPLPMDSKYCRSKSSLP